MHGTPWVFATYGVPWVLIGAGTQRHAQGIDLPTAAAQLGHTTTVLAQTYLHTDNERGAIAGKTISAVLGPAFNDDYSGAND